MSSLIRGNITALWRKQGTYTSQMRFYPPIS